MILPDHEIHRLALSGLVTPFDPDLVNPASLDVRLDSVIMHESREDDKMRRLDLSEHGFCKERPFRLMPGQFILAATIEQFSLPSNLTAQFMLKSSRAREGLEHLLAGYCDPGWHGSKLTMELHNSRQLWSLDLWPGMRIGQMIFQYMWQPPAIDYSACGHYNNDPDVTASIYQ
jgi:dCTP deaminase